MKDNPVMKWFAGVLFGAFLLAVIGFTTTLTLSVMDEVLPNSPMKWLAVGLFDGGAIAWAGAYVYRAKGTPQRGVSLLMAVLDLIGIAAMSYGGIYMGGQELASVSDTLGKTIVNTVIIATVLNVIGGYYFHMNKPDIREAIQSQELEDELTEEAMRQARLNVQREAHMLGGVLARRATARMKYRLALPMTTDEAAEWNGETIDAKAEDVPQLPASTDAHVPAWIRAFYGGVARFFGRGQNSPQPALTTTSQNTDSSSEESQSPESQNNQSQ